MISEIEKMTIRHDLDTFSKGLKVRISLLQDFIDQFQGESDMMHAFDFKDQIFEMIMKEAQGGPNGSVFDWDKYRHNPFCAKSLKKLWRRINNPNTPLT